MSRTNHDTPSFPRTLRGPRGGRHTAPTPCVDCVSFTSCRPGTCSAPFGCESWVDEDGRRVEPEPLDLATLDTPDPARDRIAAALPDITAILDSNTEPLDADRPGSIAHRLIELDDPDPEDPNPYQPSPATLSEISGIFPTDTNDLGPHADPSVRLDLEPEEVPEPDGGGFTFETMGGLVKGKCGTAERITGADARKILAVQPVKSFPYLNNDDPGPLFGGRESN